MYGRLLPQRNVVRNVRKISTLAISSQRAAGPPIPVDLAGRGGYA